MKTVGRAGAGARRQTTFMFTREISVTAVNCREPLLKLDVLDDNMVQYLQILNL